MPGSVRIFTKLPSSLYIAVISPWILFSDGEEHFNILKEEIFDSIYETYEDLSQINSYQKLKNVLEMVIKATLNSSILLNIKGLITTKEKKGICHILVNEGRIRSW